MVVTLSRLQPLRCTCVVWSLLLVAGRCLPAQEATEDLNALSRKLYQQATTATTFEELNHVLVQVDAIRDRGASPELAKYLTNLQAWVLHRRGEAYVKQAAEANAAGQSDMSRQLDVKAMEDFDAAVKLDPLRWKSYHHRGVCFALAGEFERALSDFTKTIELRPEYASAWFNRGEIHYEMGQFAKAIADYDEAIRLQANDAGFFTSRGHAYSQLRQFDKALADYGRAVELDPHNPQGITNRGDAYRSLGQWERAADDFRHAVSLDNRFGRAFQSVAWLMATCPDAQYRHGQLALRAAQRAVELDGDQDYIYLDTLAAALANNGQFDKAQEVVRRAIQLAPGENAGPLKHRLDLYRSGKPFRQGADVADKRAADKSLVR
jgi:tetratricopeptide (TPR) repeat protein